ncbi:Ankyrin repeat [Fusarium oxysporum f. sp. vasinfectum]|nr:Ankyrin repeat [Fusarium oxysporum f. sp. vasinfectum]
MRHAWIRGLFTEASVPIIPDRTSKASSRASSFDSNTKEILTLASRPDSAGPTVENASFLGKLQLTLGPQRLVEAEHSEQVTVAVRTGHVDMVNTLQDRGANVKTLSGGGLVDTMVFDSKYYTLFHWAIETNQIDTMKLFINSGIDVKVTSSSGQTPLLLAALRGSEGVVRLLIENNGSLEAGNEHGVTPLMGAIQNRHLEVVKLLLKEGANPNARDHDGNTALMMAVRVNSQSITKLLISHGASLDRRDDGGCILLHIAASEEYQYSLKPLLEAASDTETRDDSGATLLIAAAKRGHVSVVETLFENGAKVEAKDFLGGETALVNAVTEGHHSIAKANRVLWLRQPGTTSRSRGCY